MATAVISGTTTYPGTYGGNRRGPSAYDVWLETHVGSKADFLESLKGLSSTIKSLTETEEGTLIVLNDANGDHEIFLRHGIDGESITITNVEVVDGATSVTFSTGETIVIPKGEQGPIGETGVDGREIILTCDRDGVIYQGYVGDTNRKEVIDLGQVAQQQFAAEFAKNQFVKVVDELPDEPEENILYVLREEVE